MYSDVCRSDEYINRLSDFVRDEYGITLVALTPAKRGFYGETWRVEDACGNGYFLKIVYANSHKTVYEQSFFVIQHLCDHGIDFISRIVMTTDKRLSAEFDGATLGVFEWIDGENVETDATKIPEYEMLAKVYAVPTHGISITRETFSDKHADKLFGQWSVLKDKQTLLLFEKNRIKIENRAERLRKFAAICKGDTTDFYITHGDAGGNFFVSGDKNYIVDWDNPVLSPPERDAWVMCGRDWARDAFQTVLSQNGIEYTLRPERLAYHCYDFFFFYLTTFLDAGTQTDIIEEYLESWIKESIRYVDDIKVR